MGNLCCRARMSHRNLINVEINNDDGWELIHVPPVNDDIRRRRRNRLRRVVCRIACNNKSIAAHSIGFFLLRKKKWIAIGRTVAMTPTIARSGVAKIIWMISGVRTLGVSPEERRELDQPIRVC